MNPLEGLLADLDSPATREGIDVDGLKLLHPPGAGDPAGRVAFMRNRGEPGEGLKQVAALPVGELYHMLPGIRDQITRDGYLTLNTMRAHPWRIRGADLVHELRWCLCDFDSYKAGLTFGQAVGAVLDLAAQPGAFPPPSMIGRSSRDGWYGLWGIGGPGGIPATAENKRLWCETEKRLVEFFRELGADPVTRDLPRVFRVPGSLHTKKQWRVQYVVFANDRGRPFRYKLPELAAALEVPAAAMIEAVHHERETAGARQRTRLPARLPGEIDAAKALPIPDVADPRRRKMAGPCLARLRDLRKIVDARDGIVKSSPSRTFFLFVYARSLLGVSSDWGFVRDRLRLLNKGACIPPLSPREVIVQVKSAFDVLRSCKRNLFSYTIASWLQVTDDEAQRLDLETIMSTKAKRRRDEQKRRETAARKRARADTRDKGKLALVRIVNEAQAYRARIPSVRTLATELETELGTRVSKSTVHNWLGELGFRRGRRKI